MSDADDSKSKLLAAGADLFAELGLDGVTTRDIAKKAGVNISLISYYFEGKEGLYKAVLLEGAESKANRFAALMGNLDLEKLDRETFRASMRNFIIEMVRARYSDTKFHQIMEREVMAGLPYAKDIIDNVFSRVIQRVVAIYKAGQKQGFIRPEIHPTVLFLSLVHSTDMYMHMNRCQTKVHQHIFKIPEQMDQYCEQICLIYIEGVLI